MDIEYYSKIIKEYFAKEKDISTVYLFGSLVKGKARESSDVDIAVLFTEKMPLLYRFERKMEISSGVEDKLQRTVDIVDLENADLFFIHQVMLNKRLLIDKDTDKRVEFEVTKRREYFDRKSFYDMYHVQALKRLEGKGRRYLNG